MRSPYHGPDADSIWAKDSRTLEELIAEALADPGSEGSQHALAVIRFRGSQVEFDAAIRLCGSSATAERELGAAILGQLGWADKSFLAESVDVLLPMLNDPEVDVIESAIYALGHRGDARAATPLLQFRSHPRDEIREALAHALAIQDWQVALPVLLELTRDRSRDVRSWATFGFHRTDLAWQDSAEIRAALIERSGDEDPEVRGEALEGLAERKDHRAAELIRAELAKPLEYGHVLEAAELLAESSLLPALREAWSRVPDAARGRANEEFLSAYRACGGDPEDLKA